MSQHHQQPKVLVSKTHANEGIIIITINRPQVLNCVDHETASLLHDAFLELERDEKLKVAILQGSGGNFCSGADLKAMLPKSGQLDDGTVDAASKSKVANTGNLLSFDMSKPGPMGPTRMSLSKPVIAAIDGYAVAGGLELACWCDLRVATTRSKFGVFCRLRGVPLIDGGTIRLPALIGLSNAMDLILTGREISATEAKQMGLVNRLITPVSSSLSSNHDTNENEALKTSIELARLLCSHPQVCMRNDRRSALNSVYGGSGNEGVNGNCSVVGGEREKMAVEFGLGMQSLSSSEFVEAVRRFEERKTKKSSGGSGKNPQRRSRSRSSSKGRTLNSSQSQTSPSTALSPQQDPPLYSSEQSQTHPRDANYRTSAPVVSFRPPLKPGEHPFDLFAAEIWIEIVKMLRPDDCFRLRGTCTAFRFGLRDIMMDHVLMDAEPIRSLKLFAVEQAEILEACSRVEELVLPPASLSDAGDAGVNVAIAGAGAGGNQNQQQQSQLQLQPIPIRPATLPSSSSASFSRPLSSSSSAVFHTQSSSSSMPPLQLQQTSSFEGSSSFSSSISMLASTSWISGSPPHGNGFGGGSASASGGVNGIGGTFASPWLLSPTLIPSSYNTPRTVPASPMMIPSRSLNGNGNGGPPPPSPRLNAASSFSPVLMPLGASAVGGTVGAAAGSLGTGNNGPPPSPRPFPSPRHTHSSNNRNNNNNGNAIPTYPPSAAGDLFRLHHYIDMFVRQGLGDEPERYTEDFTKWVGFDDSLTGLERAERRDEWLRKGGGARGRSHSKVHWEWECAYNSMCRELRGRLCKVWAVAGRLYPFTKAENVSWKEARKAAAAAAGTGGQGGSGGGRKGNSGSNSSLKDRDDEYQQYGIRDRRSAPDLRAKSPGAGGGSGAGGRGGAQRGRKGDDDFDADSWHRNAGGKKLAGTVGPPPPISTGTGGRRNGRNRSGSPDFHRAILVDYVTVDRYVTREVEESLGGGAGNAGAGRRGKGKKVADSSTFTPGSAGANGRDDETDADNAGGIGGRSRLNRRSVGSQNQPVFPTTPTTAGTGDNSPYTPTPTTAFDGGSGFSSYRADETNHHYDNPASTTSRSSISTLVVLDPSPISASAGTPSYSPAIMSNGNASGFTGSTSGSRFYVDCLRAFSEDSMASVLRFPVELDSSTRKDIHIAAKMFGLQTCSFGDGDKRFVVAVKDSVTVIRD
ncbi:hypothetical protein HDU76_013048 [Blyttiomyces sp. JEL0837]|nr:hypothetical protein HDU76_013048 [Blyttiomyces sp. JEL0837]